jgi:pheromone shutdown protein TraB
MENKIKIPIVLVGKRKKLSQKEKIKMIVRLFMGVLNSEKKKKKKKVRKEREDLHNK